MSDIDPIVGNWYKNLENDREFEIVAFDEDEGTVAIQDADGDVEEMDLQNWYDMEVEVIETPDDWDGGMDDDLEETLDEEEDEGDEELELDDEEWDEEDE